MRVKIVVVLLQDPCSACFIIGGLMREMFDKLQKKMEIIDVEYRWLENLKNLHSIEGLEVESFPAIIINGEQITAGTIPDKREIIKRIEWESENGEC
ncbi:thioredoxin family protein [Clostridium estertheticum]|uniref:thioredoxin family protein n=1 Tax=Clostridium estertheticum TaxID=238834 RepID=UPI0013E979B4|nr:thioredoxin family protein [Clostridium estertheticum]MBZ9685995.1 thioredoxin family protein [Clostridium estertheticum]